MDVILYWNTIAQKTGDNRKWEELNPQLQNAVIQSINILIFVLETKTQA